ncbi:MAG: hypothetical protein ABF295_01905 [Flavobacteriaceae bacterium]
MSKQKVFSSVVLWLLCGLCLSAQYTVTRCSEMGFRPKSYDPYLDLWTDILGYYLNPMDAGGGENDCWVYENSNGLDHVIIPNSWQNNLTADIQSLIRSTMTALVDSRTKYRDYGSLNNELYFLFEDRPGIETEPFAHNLISNQCWMQSHIDYFNAYSEAPQKQYFVAHEVAHCFNMENIESDLFVNNYSFNEWFDESVSEFMASEVYIDVNIEYESSVEFDLDAVSFAQPYNAWPLWYYFVLQRGKNALVPEMNTLTRLTNRSGRLRHYRSSGFDQLYHDFLFEFYTRSLQDRGGGGIAIEDTILRRQDKIQLIPDAPTPIILDTIPTERLSMYQLVIPASYDVTIYPPDASNRVHFSILNHPDKIKDWNEPVLIDGYCDREREFRLLVSHLNDDPLTDISIEYELNERIGCCTLTTAITKNPSPDELEGQFHFDYYIESEVESLTDGETTEVEMNYYVNSKDGSMLLLKSWFTENFGRSESGGMKAEAVIWLANGQVVAYVEDEIYGQKRAITLDMNQTRGDVMGPRAINPEELLREGLSSGVSPAALPSDSPWAGNSTPYAYYREERFDPGVRNLMTAYVSNDVSVVASPMSSFGFMVGHIKDLSGQNKHLVYTRYETPGGEIMRAKLHKLEKLCASFDGEGYKKMTLMGSTGAIGAMTDTERDDLVASQQAYNARLAALLQEMGRCGDDENCIARKKQEMLQLKKEKESAIYDLNENSEFTGTAGSNFQSDERAIKERMYNLQGEAIEQERRCNRLRDSNAACGGCMNNALRLCTEQLDDLKTQINRLECELFKLHGMGDMMDDCE